MERFKTWFALGIVYIVWGSTFIAIRISVAEMPWALMAGTRFVIAGGLVLGLLLLTRQSIRISPRDLAVLAGAGVLLLGTGNGFLALGETTVPAGLAALVIATIPLWVAALEMLIPGGERLTAGGWFGLALGLVGLAVLLVPRLLREQGVPINPWGVAVLLVSSLSWALGTILLRRRPVKLNPFASTGYQTLAGGLFNLGLAVILRQAWPAHYSPALLGAIGYLVVFGSLIALSAFTWLTRHLAPAKLITYAYVNPVVAVLLGVTMLHETLDAPMLIGMAIILAAVVLVSRARVARVTPAAAPLAPTPLPASTGD